LRKEGFEMKITDKIMIMITGMSCFVIVGLILLNGCKKSAPSTSSTTEMSNNDMANMENHEGMTMTMSSDAEAKPAPNGQAICPVMGQLIDQSVFVEYQGKKVYFCCEDCKAKFLAEPEKYIAQLPQFAEDQSE
jgi:YHS domain-containing protein